MGYKFKGYIIPVKSGIIMLILGGGVLAGILFLISYTRPPQSPVGAVTAALTVIPSFSSTVTPAVSESASADIRLATSTLEPGVIGIGVFVQVSGTGGDGLRLRQGPSLGHEMQFLGLDGELFQVGDGPIAADGYTWWFVIGSYDETRQGWAASEFLEVVPNP